MMKKQRIRQKKKKKKKKGMKEKAEVGGPYSKCYQVLRRMEPFYVVIADIVILPRHTLAYAAVVNM